MFADIKRKKEKRRRKFSWKIVAASFCSRVWWNPMEKVVWACLFTTLKNLSPRTLCLIYFYIYYLRYLIKDGFWVMLRISIYIWVSTDMTLRLSSVQDQPLKTDIPTAESNLMVYIKRDHPWICFSFFEFKKWMQDNIVYILIPEEQKNIDSNNTNLFSNKHFRLQARDSPITILQTHTLSNLKM